MDQSIPKGEAPKLVVKKKRRWLRPIAWLLLIGFIIIQFFQADKNNNDGRGVNHISSLVAVPDTVERILKVACYDCHSNYTRYPWYTNIQPFGWWLADHIYEGRRHLNFDEYASYSTKRRKEKLKEIKETIEDESMPLNSYTWIHKEAKLDARQKQLIIGWVDSAANSINALSLKK